MALKLLAISNPVITRGPDEAARDMVILSGGGTLYCFYISVTSN